MIYQVARGGAREVRHAKTEKAETGGDLMCFGSKYVIFHVYVAI